MKVLVYTSLFPNHLQPNNAIFIKQRMLAFAKLDGCSIKVVAPIPYSPPWRILGRRYAYSQIGSREIMEGVEIFHPRFPLAPKVSMVFHGLSMFLSSIKTVKGLHSNYPFDIIDGHYIYPDGLAAIWLGKLFRKPVVLSARGSDINQFVRFRSIRPMLQYALGKADHVISVCDALKEEMVHLGIRKEKITVVPNGIDLDGFKPEDRSIARDKVGLREDGKILLSVGSLTPRKGIHFTLEGLPLVLHQHNDLEFYVIGEGPYRKNLERLTGKLNLERRVHLIGERPHSELSSWYSAADVVCLASSREGWANVIMESLACGTPVVATNVWGAPEIITSKDVGMLVRQSPEAIAHGVIEALSRNWDRDKIRIHVRGRTWENVAGEVKKVFTSVVN